MSDRLPDSPFQMEAAEKANKDLGNVKGLLSSEQTAIPILNKYEESEVNRDNSFKDTMTGFLNRRGLVEEYKLEQKTRERLGAPGNNTLIVLDVIGLKKMNTKLTEPGADKVIKEATASLRKQIRETDLAGRWGGDEFLLILFGADREAAKTKIKEILDNLPNLVHYNIGYQVVGFDSDPESAMNNIMSHMDEIKQMGPIDKTGRSVGTGIVVDVDSLYK